MGIRDAVSSAADSLKKRLPDPEPVKNAGRSAYSTAASKSTGGAPELRTPVAGNLRSFYNHGSSALSTVDQAVRIKGVQRVKESMPDKEVLVRIGWNLTDIALDKYTRFLTGGLPVYRTMRDALMKKDAKTTRNIFSEQEIQEIWSRTKRLEAESLARDSQPSVGPRHRKRGPHLRSRL